MRCWAVGYVCSILSLRYLCSALVFRIPRKVELRSEMVVVEWNARMCWFHVVNVNVSGNGLM